MGRIVDPPRAAAPIRRSGAGGGASRGAGPGGIYGGQLRLGLGRGRRRGLGPDAAGGDQEPGGDGRDGERPALIVMPVPRALTNADCVAATTSCGAPPSPAPEPRPSTSRSRASAGTWERLLEVVTADPGDERAERGDAEGAADHPEHAQRAEATPALVRSTAFIAPMLIGDITMPMPKPSRMNAPIRYE